MSQLQSYLHAAETKVIATSSLDVREMPFSSLEKTRVCVLDRSLKIRTADLRRPFLAASKSVARNESAFTSFVRDLLRFNGVQMPKVKAVRAGVLRSVLDHAPLGAYEVDDAVLYLDKRGSDGVRDDGRLSAFARRYRGHARENQQGLRLSQGKFL